MKRVFIYTMLLFPLFEVCAQNCSENLENAKRAYYNGQIREVPKLLEGCISGLGKEELIEGYKLLINAYLIDGENELAERHMEELLRHDPLYKVQGSDMQEFINLRENYTAISQYTVGFLIGAIRPDYHIMRHHSIAGNVDEPSDYNEHPGISIGLAGDILLYQRFYANVSLLYDKRSFDQEEIILDFQRVYSEERQHRLTIPLMIRYIQPIKKWNIFAGGGYGVHYLIKATGDFLHTPLEGDFPVVDGTPYFKENVDITDQHNRITGSWQVSCGIQRPVGKYTLEFSFSYERGLSNLIDEDKRYFNKELTDNFAYVPDDVRVHAYKLNMAIYRNFYKAKKRQFNRSK